ncbi:MAG: beta-3-deoxy-D-manno-oct-2-ulosonic acid transferase [Burkholderiaceae bacterium]
MHEIKVLGFSLRKRRLLASFLPEAVLKPIDDAQALHAGDTVAVWSSTPAAATAADAARRKPGLTVLRVEDGFLRSVGLGAQLARPLSWVIDGRGIYYDPSCPSDLEMMLERDESDASLIERARRLRERIVAAGISKYNLGDDRWHGLSSRRDPERPVILAVGQVEADASVRTGTRAVATNAGLLEAARRHHPEGWLVYRPHPDVIAGLRRAGSDEVRASALADEIMPDAPITRLIDAADAVHVMTSLTGFEALLRDRAVYCHGLPFYAGWGLTTDAVAIARRTRLLSLDELVAATLLRYPKYVSRATGRPCSAEQALEELIEWRRCDPERPRWWHALLTPVLRRE